MESKSSKTTFISPRSVLLYRVWLAVLMIPFPALILFSVYQFLDGQRFPYFFFIGGVIGWWQLFNVYRKIKPVEFDDEFLYVTEKGFEVVMPLDNIRNIELKSLNGYYKITLSSPIQSGKEIYFKPSLIYPLDYKRQDEKVRLLRDFIWKSKKNFQSIPPNALHS